MTAKAHDLNNLINSASRKNERTAEGGRTDMRKQKSSKPEKFRPFLMIASGVFLAFLISAAALIYNTHSISLLNTSGWVTVDGIGSKDADFITRAVIAKIGLFANSKDKTLYFAARTGDGIDYKKLFANPSHWFLLSNEKHYRIKGNIRIPAAWWSITLYDANDFLVRNPENRYSYTNYNLITDADGNFTIDVAAQKPAEATNWLPAPLDGPFNLKLRIYEPSSQIHENITTYPLPRVMEVSAP
jgi:hypothetical protein